VIRLALLTLAAALAAVPVAHATLAGGPGNLAFERGSDVWISGAGGQAPTEVRAGAAAPAWSPDGSRLALADGGIATIAPDGTGFSPLTSDPTDEDPAWRPHGGSIVFSRGGTLSEVTLGGAVTDLGQPGSEPDVSPDGLTVAYARGGDIWTFDGTTARQLTTTPTTEDSPSWSPDGRRIVFSSGTGLGAMNADGSGRATLPSGMGDQPAWSPDGSLIAFDRAPDVWLANADGSSPRALTAGERPAWQSLPAASLGGHGAASPYPVVMNVSGRVGVIDSVSVRLSGLYHAGSLSEVDLLLVGPGGRSVTLLSDVAGGSGPASVDLVLKDGAPAMPASGALASGEYAPTDHEPGDAFPPPAETGSAETGTDQTGLAAFRGVDPNGVWLLYAVDDSPSLPGRIGRVQLEIATRSQSTRDTTAPSLTASLSPRRFRVGGSGVRLGRISGAQSPRGTRIRWQVSERAMVRLVIERAMPGRRRAGRCRKPNRRNRSASRCLRWVPRGSIVRRVRAGRGSVRFSGRTRRKPLPPGRYRVRARAFDNAGNRSVQRRLGFRIVRR
jgi:WD40 repeat protein